MCLALSVGDSRLYGYRPVVSTAEWPVLQTSVGLADSPAARDRFGLGTLLLVGLGAVLQGQKGDTHPSVQGLGTAKTSGINNINKQY